MRFNLVHVIAKRRDYHGLLGYREVIESVQWGLEALGHQVSFTINKIADCSNIIFGQQMLNEETLASLPANTICYNMEQIAGATAAEIKPELHTTARLFQVWDYSRDNLAAWESLNPLRRPIHVPIGYAPVLSRIPHRMNPFIDVLFYGFPTAGRLELFARLCDMGLHSVFVCGLYGRERDELIERSKVILNYNAYDKSRVFEIVRCHIFWPMARRSSQICIRKRALSRI